MGDHGDYEEFMASWCVADWWGPEMANFWALWGLRYGVLSQEGHTSSLDPAVTVAVHGHVGSTGCPRSHSWCLRRGMLVSVLQDQCRAVGSSPKHPTCRSLHKTTRWSSPGGPGKVVQARQLPAARDHQQSAIRTGQKHAGNEGMGPSALHPALYHFLPSLCSSSGWRRGAKTSRASEVGQCGALWGREIPALSYGLGV